MCVCLFEKHFLFHALARAGNKTLLLNLCYNFCGCTISTPKARSGCFIFFGSGQWLDLQQIFQSVVALLSVR